ncbi:MAG: aldehyde dehydrogenase family protein, partial [Gammaproteobacteria bacterium]
MAKASVTSILQSLGLAKTNAGVWTSTGGWRKSRGAKVLQSINPATGKVIARVTCATEADYDQIIR